MATNEKFIAEFLVRGLQDLDKAKDKISAINDKINLLATSLLGASFGQFILGALEAADRVSDLSDATGISITNLKAFEDAMQSAGGKSKNLERAITGFSQSIETANMGSDRMREAFDKVGISMGDLKNLSEEGLLDKAIAGLAKLKEEGKSASEISSVATQLLTKAFRGVDVEKFVDDFNKGKITMAELADNIKLAAEANAKLEEKFRTLQAGALQAIQPILEGMGEMKLTSESAAKIITAVGVALAISFGATLLANIVAINTAILGTVAASTLLGKNPFIKLILGGSLVALEAAGAYGAYNLALKEAEESQKKLSDAQAEALKNGGKTADTAKADANRAQELSAKQKAAIESNKRIAQANADTDKEVKLRTASDIEKIEVERDANIAKMRQEINAKTDLSIAQRKKEIAAQETLLNTKAATDIAAVKRDQEKTIYDQRKGYADQIQGLLGVEKSETQKVTDLIAEQPLKYKEIGDQLLANARAQDTNLTFLKEYIKEQARLKSLNESMQKIQVDTSMEEFFYTSELKKQAELRKADGPLERKLIEDRYALQSKYVAKLQQQKEYQAGVNALLYEGEDLTAKQSQDLADFLAVREELTRQMEGEKAVRQENIRLIYEEQSTFMYGWNEAFKAYAESANSATDRAKTYFGDFTKGIEDAFISFAKTGKLSFQNLIDSMIADVIRFQIRSAISNQSFGGLFGSLGALFGLGKGAGGGSIVDSSVSSSILPGAVFGAAGGSLMADRPRMVGEAGPELFIPASNGTLIANNQLGGGGTTNISYNIQAVDASSFRTLVARDPQFIYAVTEQGRRSQPSRRLS